MLSKWAHLVESRYYKRFILKGWKSETREALTRFLDVQSVNPMLKTCLVGVPRLKSGTDGVSGQDRKTPT